MLDNTITLINDGNVDITNATLTDTVEGYPTQTLTSHTGDTTNPGTLDVNETWTYTAKYTVTQTDLDNNAGGDGKISYVATASTTQLDTLSLHDALPISQHPDWQVHKTASIEGSH